VPPRVIRRRRREGMSERETQREDAVIYIFIAIVVIMTALALYGFFSGRWSQFSVG